MCIRDSRCVASQTTPFCEGKNNIDNSLSAVSRSIMGLGRIDIEGVAGGGIEIFKVKRNIIYVSLAVVWFGKETVYPIHYSAGFVV